MRKVRTLEGSWVKKGNRGGEIWGFYFRELLSQYVWHFYMG